MTTAKQESGTLGKAFDNHTLEVIDLKTGRQVHTIPGMDEPQGRISIPRRIAFSLPAAATAR